MKLISEGGFSHFLSYVVFRVGLKGSVREDVVSVRMRDGPESRRCEDNYGLD